MQGWKIALWTGLVALTCFFLYQVRLILLPFILGFLVAILLEPMVRRLRVRGMKRSPAVMLVFSVFFAVLIGVTLLTIPVMTRQLATLTGSTTKLTRDLMQQSYANNYFLRWNPKQRAEQSVKENPLDAALGTVKPTLDRFGLPSTQSAVVEQYIEPRRKEITTFVRSFFNSVLGILSSVTGQLLILPLTPFIALFILLDFDNLRRNFPNWIPPAFRKQVIDTVSDVGDVFLNYLRGMTISLLLYTTILAIVLTIVGAPYGVLLALLFGVLYLIPVIGAPSGYVILFISTGLSGVTGNWFIQSGSSWAFAGVCMLAMILTSESYDKAIHPNLVGHAVGLSPLVSMFVVFAGASLFGVLGMILAFPLGGAIKVILDRLMRVTTATGSDTLGLPVTPLRHRISTE
jgi:predicted PurR-regulated permease PerM